VTPRLYYYWLKLNDIFSNKNNQQTNKKQKTQQDELNTAFHHFTSRDVFVCQTKESDDECLGQPTFTWSHKNAVKRKQRSSTLARVLPRLDTIKIPLMHRLTNIPECMLATQTKYNFTLLVMCQARPSV